jgi:hypothetical protein
MNLVRVFPVFLLLLLSVLIQVRSVLVHVAAGASFTPSVTLSPTFPPTITPSGTLTPVPTQTRIVVTVIHTKIITVIPTTSTPNEGVTNTTVAPTNTTVVTSTTIEEKETGNQSLLSIAIIGMVATFIGGLVVGLLWSNWRKR